VRIVVNVIALESLSQVLDAAKKRNLEPEILSLHVAKGERTGNYHLMKGQNPVYVISMGGRDPWAGVG
jgi:precorrin-6B methylase 2